MADVKDNLAKFRERQQETEGLPDQEPAPENEQEAPQQAVLNHNDVFAQMLGEQGGSRKQLLALYARGGLTPIAESIVEACTTPDERLAGFVNVLVIVVDNFLSMQVQAMQQREQQAKQAQASKIAVAQAIPANKLHV